MNQKRLRIAVWIHFLHWNIKYGYYCLLQIWMTVHSVQVDELTEVVFCVLVMLCTVFCPSNPFMCGTAASLGPGLPWKVSPFVSIPSSSLPSQVSLRFSQSHIFYGVRLSISCTWRTRLSVCIWVIAFELSVMEDPASSYATDIALMILWSCKPHPYIRVGLFNILSNSVAGKLNLELKRYKEAEVYYKDLLMRNPENTTYYARLQEAQQLTTASEKLSMFSEFQDLFPRALAPRRLPLTYAVGEFYIGFIKHIWGFCLNMLHCKLKWLVGSWGMGVIFSRNFSCFLGCNTMLFGR